IGNIRQFASLFSSIGRSAIACETGGNTMKKILIVGAIAMFATSAFAKTTTVSTEYYVVRDEATKKCTIVDKKPTTTTTIVDNGIFKTRTEAETGMKTMKVCTE